MNEFNTSQRAKTEVVQEVSGGEAEKEVEHGEAAESSSKGEGEREREV